MRSLRVFLRRLWRAIDNFFNVTISELEIRHLEATHFTSYKILPQVLARHFYDENDYEALKSLLRSCQYSLKDLGFTEEEIRAVFPDSPNN